MKTLKLCAIALSLSFAALAAGAATIVTKEGTGEAAVVGKDSQKAFDEAKERALRHAVEQAAGVRVDADTTVINNQLVRDQVFANSSGYVKKYDVVSKKEEKGVVTVVVKADVITENLDKDITAAQDLVKRMGRPSMVIMVNEQTLQMGAKGQAITTSDTMATVLAESFRADGWDLKDPAFAAGKVRIAPGATLGAAEAKEIGDLSKSAFILYGSATLRNADVEAWMIGNDGKQIIFPVTGEFDLSLFATKTGDQFAKVSGKLVMPNENKGLVASSKTMLVSFERTAFDLIQKRRTEIIESVRKHVLEYFRNQQVNGTEIALSVSGLDGFSAARDFEASITSVRGIKRAERKTFVEGKATYQVSFLGSANDLASAMDGSKFKKRKVEVTSVSINSLALNLTK